MTVVNRDPAAPSEADTEVDFHTRSPSVTEYAVKQHSAKIKDNLLNIQDGRGL